MFDSVSIKNCSFDDHFTGLLHPITRFVSPMQPFIEDGD